MKGNGRNIIASSSKKRLLIIWLLFGILLTICCWPIIPPAIFIGDISENRIIVSGQSVTGPNYVIVDGQDIIKNSIIRNFAISQPVMLLDGINLEGDLPEHHIKYPGTCGTNFVVTGKIIGISNGDAGYVGGDGITARFRVSSWQPMGIIPNFEYGEHSEILFPIFIILVFIFPIILLRTIYFYKNMKLIIRIDNATIQT